ncbi:MAG: SGNH/GDSL hydrolase family protein [Myxococcota bacterium]
MSRTHIHLFAGHNSLASAKRALSRAFCGSAFALLLACSSTGSNDATGGTNSGSGGNNASKGGNTNSGGSVSSGGAVSFGGSANGGNPSGGSANGGAPNGGTQSSGGTNTNGGSASSSGGQSGGAPSTGGNTNSGGRASQGGGSSSGGNAQGGTNSGGRSAQGGTTANGGANSGGTTSNGGSGGGGSYNPCPTNGDPCKILPLGDSITYGLITVAADKPNGKDSNGGYRLKFFANAVTAKQKIAFTGSQQNGPDMVSGVAFSKYHEGHSGFTIDDSTGNGINDETVLGPGFRTTPDIVLLHIGTNDVYSAKGMQSGMADRLGKLLDELVTRAPNALIVVAKIVPLASQNTALNNYNNAIPGVVATRVAQGKHIIVVDTFTGFKSSMLSADSVHPNQSGYDFMGDTFYTAVSSLLPK